MASHHTGGGEGQDDSDTDLSEHGDKTEKSSEKGKRSVKQKFLHSKAVRRMTGGKKRGADVAPVKKLKPPPAHLQAPTAKRTSDTVQQPPEHSQEQQDDQQMLFQYKNSPTQQRRPVTSPHQTHATAGTVLREQPQRHPSNSDPPHPRHPPQQSMGYDHLQQCNPHQPDYTYLEDEQEEDYRHGDPTSSDQQLRRLELENKRLKREKEMVDNTVQEYEALLAAKDQEISRMRKVRTEPVFHHVSPVTEEQTKLEMSLVARDAEITQLTADKNLLEHELQELQTKYKCLITEKDAASHQVDTVTHQLRTAQEMSDSMKEENRTLTEKLQRMEKPKKTSPQEQQQKDRIKQLEDELRGMAAEKRASEEAVRKQAQRNQEQYEQLQRRFQTKEDEDKQLRQELLDVQSQLEDSAVKVTALEQTKELLQIQFDEDKRNWETELRNKLQEEKAQSHTTQQQLRQELDLLQREQLQKILAAKKEASEQFAGKYKEKKMKYKNKIEALEQEVRTKQNLTENIEIRYETRLAEQQQQLSTMQKQLMAARESANHSSRQVIELTEEKRRLVNSYETKLVEEKRSMEEYVAQLQQQKESQQQTEGPSSLREGSQSSDGAGASSITSLEEKQADLREELNGKDCEIEKLKKVVNDKELLNVQLEETVRRLESDASKTHGVVSAATALTRTVEQLRSKLDEKDAEVRRLTEESTELRDCITSLTDSDEQSSQEVLQLRDKLAKGSSEAESLIQSLNRVTKANQTLEQEKAGLITELKESQSTVDSLVRRIESKESTYKKEMLGAEATRKEIESKLVEEIDKRSQLFKEFGVLKEQYVKLQKENTESGQALNSRTRQLDAKQGELEELQNELVLIRAQLVTYQEDFLHERSDREKVHGQMEDLKEKSAVTIKNLKTDIQNLKSEIQNLKTGATVTTEEFQISQSQIIAYKKQLDACKKELEEERRRGHVMQERIDTLNAIQEQATMLEAENVELKKGVSNFHNERTRLEQEVEQLRRNVGNYQMEQARASRLEQEKNQLMVHYRELENRNAQLKTANQVLSGRLKEAKASSTSSPPLPSSQQPHNPRQDRHNTQPIRQWGTAAEPNVREHGQQLPQQHYSQQDQHHQQQQERLYWECQRPYYQQHGLSQQESGSRTKPPGDGIPRQQLPVSSSQYSHHGGLNVRPHQESHGLGAAYGRQLGNTNAAVPYSSIDESMRMADRQQWQVSNAPGRPHTASLPSVPPPNNAQHLPPSPLAREHEFRRREFERETGRGGTGGFHQGHQEQVYSSATKESSSGHHGSDNSDVAENPLIEGIDKDMLAAQDEVHKMYADPNESINDPEQSFEIPYDPNLVCPKCGRQFRRGEIQKFRKHHEGCTGR